MLEVFGAAVQAVFQDPQVLLVIVICAFYGIFVGAIPGLTATMAVALMVPLTFFLTDVQAIAAIVTTVTCTIFAGDIPATLLRIPGTPASAAYVSDAYALTRAGRSATALNASLFFSVAGGVFGAFVLATAAPQLARMAARFTMYEYFWLYVMGLTCAAVVSDDSRLKGTLGLSLGLLLSCVGLGIDYGRPRLTLGIDALIDGVSFIPAMIGLFGMSEVLRISRAWSTESRRTFEIPETAGDGQVMTRTLSRMWKRKVSLVRSSTIGAIVGMLPGAGADIAAWISYAVSKRFAAEPELYGKGSLEGLSDASGANNAALGSAWIPALVFGIPGDSVTAIAIGVLSMKNITPGPKIFDSTNFPEQAVLAASIFVTFLVANIVLIPVGLLAIRVGSSIIRVPKSVLMPAIVLFCVLGAFAMQGSYLDVIIMIAMGVLGFFLESWGVPLGPVVLGIILGPELEHRFIQCLTESSGAADFWSSGISKVLMAICLLLWLGPIVGRAVKRVRG
ncbi:MAG: tripartite tricarboxylate transporter permease [Planctomycetales bacterium]|nr:tripartite tricarboxylate transporter permease [Planctomycetales bacterium]